MTVHFLSGFAGSVLAGEQAATVFLRCSTTELLKLALQAGFEPATPGVRGEVSVAYATGQGGEFYIASNGNANSFSGPRARSWTGVLRLDDAIPHGNRGGARTRILRRQAPRAFHQSGWKLWRS